MFAVDQPWLLWAFLSACFAALTAIFAKVGVAGVDSDLATLIRTVVISAVLTMLLASTGKLKGISVISPRTWLFMVLSALATGASWLCYFRALQTGSVSRVAPIDKLSVVFVALISTVVLGEHLSMRGWAGVGLIAAGAVCVALA